MSEIIIIGAGVIGCSIARELSRYNVKITVIDKENDVSCGTSKANSGIVHGGHDAKPGTLKAKFNIEGNAMFDELSKELDFPFRRNGAFVLCFDESGFDDLTALYQRGITNGVKGLEIMLGDKAREKEPSISKNVKAALYVASSGIVSPYEMTVAYAENAFTNGVEFKLNTKVLSLTKQGDKFIVSTDKGEFTSDFVINCAGVYADDINNYVCRDKLKIVARRGEYMLLDKSVGYLTSATLFQLPTKMGKGILIAPTTHGNILIGPTAEDIENKDDLSTSIKGLAKAFESGLNSISELNKRNIITQFTGLRAHGGDDFIIGESETKGFYNVACIESPGLTAAPAIAKFVSHDIANIMKLSNKSDFIKTRKGIPHFATMSDSDRAELIKSNKLYGNIVCRCEVVTEGEIVDSINRPLGARDLDGVKRRTRAGMGRCQSGFCGARVMEILSRELNIPMQEVTKFGKDSKIVVGELKNERN